jgi:glycosyltransferase involved in cell wall biosynthesis
MSDDNPALSIVLPFRNQADHAGQILNRYRNTLESLGRPYELIVVPNACTDETEAIVSAFVGTCPKARVILSSQGGWGHAVQLGLGNSRGEVLCYTNSARTDPDDVARLYELYRQNAPCLAKVGRHRRGALLRAAGSWLYNLEARLLFGIRAGDVNGTPKMFSRELYRQLSLRSCGDLLDLELLARVTQLGVRVVELPVAGFQRHGGQSTTSFRSALRMYTGAFALRRELAPWAGPIGRGND